MCKNTIVIVLFLLNNAVQYASCTRLGIIPSLDSSCPGESIGETCLTLQQYLANSSLSTSYNITLELYPGQHHLNSRLSTSNINTNSFIMRAVNTASVLCSQSSYFSFNQLQHFYISDIAFISCRMNLNSMIDATFVRNSFTNPTGTVLSIGQSSVQIKWCIFFGQTSTYRTLSVSNGNITLFESNISGFGVTGRGRSGGAVYVYEGRMTIINCRFINNSAGGHGGAVYVKLGRELIINNSYFSDNTTPGRGYGGGAIRTYSVGRSIIMNSCFSNNRVGGYGGAVYVSRGDMTVTNSYFLDNAAGYSGADVYVYEGEVDITNSYFSDNAVGGHRAVYVQYGEGVTISKSYFCDNTTETNSGHSRTVYIRASNGSSIIVTNNTFLKRASGQGSTPIFYGGSYTSISLTENTINYNTTAAYCGVPDVDEFYHCYTSPIMDTIPQEIPPPSVIITSSPTSAVGFFEGLDLTLTCSIVLTTSIVNTPVVVEGHWTKNGSVLDENNHRITVSNITGSGTNYQITVRFNPVTSNDSGTYLCTSTVTSADTSLNISAENSDSETINVVDFPTQTITSLTANGSSTAGHHGYTLTCIANRNILLSNSSILEVEWIGINSNVISRGANFSIFDSGPTNDAELISRLTFHNLFTSQAGQYTCRTLLTIPGTISRHLVEQAFIVQVKLPTPQATSIRTSREGPLYEGTSFSLTCIISLNKTGVDTPFMMQTSFPGPLTQEDDRFTTSNLTMVDDTFQVTLTISPVSVVDVNSPYTCSASVTSLAQHITTSDVIQNTMMINVEVLPPPSVTVFSAPSSTAGQTHTLTCVAVVVEYLTERPMLEWLSTDAVIQSEQINSGSTVSNRILTFAPLRTTHGGIYTCLATINISRVNITERRGSINQSVIVQIPPPAVIVSSSHVPYSGTIFNLTGDINLDSAVDIPVTAVGIWRDGNGVTLHTNVVTALPPSSYSSVLMFMPLSSVSSGSYTLTYSVEPASDNAQYVIGITNSTVHFLTVQALPPLAPTITVTSRGPSNDSCEEVTVLTCSNATLVDNLFAPPSVMWWDDHDIPVPTVGNPTVDPTNGELTFTGITPANAGTYTCRMVINVTGADSYGQVSTTVDNTLPAKVQNLNCSGVGKTTLSLTWEKPQAHANEVVSYIVDVKRLQHRDSTREVESVTLLGQLFDKKVEGLLTTVVGLEEETPYNVTVKAVNLAGCGKETQIYCFTQEGVPPQPGNVAVVRLTSVSMRVSWDRLTLVELKGLGSYVIRYIRSDRNDLQENVITVSWTESNVTIDNLQPGVQYDVTVAFSSKRGTSLPSKVVALQLSNASMRSDNTGTIIGGVVAIVLTIAVTIAVITKILATFMLKSRKVEVTLKQERNYDVPEAVKLSNLSHTQVKSQAREAEHEYEELDKYNHEYAEVKFYDPPTKLKKGLSEAEDNITELNTYPAAYIYPITASKTSAQEFKGVEV